MLAVMWRDEIAVGIKESFAGHIDTTAKWKKDESYLPSRFNELPREVIAVAPSTGIHSTNNLPWVTMGLHR